MDQAFFDQLDHWHRQEQFQQIIDAIEAIPAEQRGYELTGLLALSLIHISEPTRP